MGDKVKKKLSPIGYPGKAYLSNVEEKFRQATMEWHEKQDCLLRFMNLQNKINMLDILIRRILRHYDDIDPLDQNTVIFYKFLIDLESYFYLLTSVLDILAKITPYFYPSLGKKKTGYHNFTNELRYFKEQNSKNEYAEYLENNMHWYEEVKKHRNELTHSGALIMFPSSNNKWYFGTYRENKSIPNQEVKNFITDSYTNYIKFLIFYNKFFGARAFKP